jgi:hypothetical protein
MSGVSGVLNPTTALCRIDPAHRDSDRINISNCTISGGLLFNEDGSDGTFTAVADASVASTNIDSVTDSGGLARFNFTPGPTLYVGQQVTNTGFVNSNYNQTIQITAVGSGYYESDSIDFGGNETIGSFTSDSVTLTDTGTTLTEGDSVNIDTDLATDYDGGSTVYNVLTNTFQINRAATANNPQTGSWSTKGLNEMNNKILAVNNSNFDDSEYIASAFVNDNSATIAGADITNGTFRNYDFGTLTETSNAQRFKLITANTGINEYTGNEPFNGTLAYDHTAVSTGGAVEFLFKWQKSTSIEASGSHDGANNAATLTDSTASFTVNAFIGFYIRNITDGSEGLITANTATTVTANLESGTDNDWDTNDIYEIREFVDLDNNIVRMNEIGATAEATTGHALMLLNKGDQIKPVFTRDSGASSFTPRYFNYTTTE